MEITRSRAIKAWKFALSTRPENVSKTLGGGGYYRVAIFDRFKTPDDADFDTPIDVPHIEFRLEKGIDPDGNKAYRIIADDKWIVDGWIIDGAHRHRFSDGDMLAMERARGYVE